MELDIGQNLTGLITQLAQTIGTTAEKVFPWYVKEAQIIGITHAILLITFTLIPLIILFCIRNKEWFDECAEPTAHGVAFIGCMVVLLTVLLIGSLDLSQTLNCIYNPEKVAITNITKDIARLQGK